MGCLPPPPSRFVIFVLQVKPPVLNFFTFFWREKTNCYVFSIFLIVKYFPFPKNHIFGGAPEPTNMDQFATGLNGTRPGPWWVGVCVGGGVLPVRIHTGSTPSGR